METENASPPPCYIAGLEENEDDVERVTCSKKEKHHPQVAAL